MPLIDIIGTLAAIGSLSMAIPQIYKSWTTKSVDDLSLLSMAILVVSSALWFTVGAMIPSIPIMVSDGFATIFAAIMLWIRLKYGSKAKQP